MKATEWRKTCEFVNESGKRKHVRGEKVQGGWIKLYRDLLDKPIWLCSKPEQKAVLITLLMMANHEQKEWIWKGKKYICLPGQFITSLESISDKAGVSVRSVRTALKNFEQIYDFLTNESTKQNRLISITNWALYQSEQERPTNESTNDRQTTDKRPTTNKNNKNYKNIDDHDRAREVYNFYQNNIGLLSLHQIEVINSYLDDGISQELIIEAMKNSLGADNVWQYLVRVLNNCIDQNVKNLEQYNAKKSERKRRGQNGRNKKDNGGDDGQPLDGIGIKL